MNIPFQRWLTIILFPLFPLLFIYFRNQAFIFEGGLIWPVLCASSASIIIYLVLNFLNPKKTNNVLLVLFGMGWFLLYGHVYYFFMDVFDLTLNSFRHRFFIPVYSIGFLLPLWYLWKAPYISDTFINVVFIIGLVLNLQFIIPALNWYSGNNKVSGTAGNTISKAHMELPDVYYIILDSYTNNENLQKYFQYDNSPFTNQLKNIGFTVIENAKSNYPYTRFSLPSSLNMEYINYFEDSISTENQNEEYSFAKIHHNKVMRYFKLEGYKYILYATAYQQLNDQSEADIYIGNNLTISDYYQSLIQLSVLNCLNLEFYGRGVYDLCKKALRILPSTTEIKGNKFVFFHCLPPHPPIVFDENGNYIPRVDSENDYKKTGMYMGQLKFINNQIIKAVKEILKNSQNPPIIIIQGDHGTASSTRFEDSKNWGAFPTKELLQERFGILNAIFLPDNYKINFPKNHTPVNTFRFILNKLFNDSLPILPCKSYFANYKKTYNFREINWPAVEGVVNDSLLK